MSLMTRTRRQNKNTKTHGIGILFLSYASMNTRDGSALIVALFNSKQAADITKRIKEYEKLQRKVEEPIAHDEEWTRQKKFYYPDEPVINLGEMDEKTMYPYGRPKKEKTGFTL